MGNHDEVFEKVRAQQAKFNEELPELIKHHHGKWICYRDGVQLVANDHDEAYVWGLKQFGMDGGFVIDQAIEHEPIPAWKLGGLGAAAVYEQQHAELQAKYAVLAAENTRLRAVVDAAIVVSKSPGYREHEALREALKAMGAR